MYLARIPVNRRDYCAHHLIDLQRCKRENFPFLGKCEHFTHEWNECQNQEYLLINFNAWKIRLIIFLNFSVIYRMKEFERERRLLQREHRKKANQEKETLENLE